MTATLPPSNDPGDSDARQLAAELDALHLKCGIPAPVPETHDEAVERYSMMMDPASRVAAGEAIEQARAPVAATDADAKRLANLRARAALAGCEVYVSTDDHGKALFVASKWALCKHLHSLDELAAWVAMVDGLAE